jgi:hypothetical protein
MSCSIKDQCQLDSWSIMTSTTIRAEFIIMSQVIKLEVILSSCSGGALTYRVGWTTGFALTHGAPNGEYLVSLKSSRVTAASMNMSILVPPGYLRQSNERHFEFDLI